MIALDRIELVRAWRLSLPLSRPYHLSLGAIDAFETILVEIGNDQRVACGEATYLTGYTDEIVERAWEKTNALMPLIVGTSSADARAVLAPLLSEWPFTVTAFGTALDMLEHNALLDVKEQARVPLLSLLQGETDVEIAKDVDDAIAGGFSTLKVKVGFDVDADLARIATIQRINDGRCLLRLDANQGYARDDAVRFASSLDPDAIELFEQPCAKEDWQAALDVARVSRVPMMLDESIYGAEDIERAAQLGAARFVKLKLMKSGSVDILARDLARIRALGMEPVLGNGVATDVSNWMEACVARGLVGNALESNGFLKLRRSVLTQPLRFEHGSIVLDPGWTPRVDTAAAQAQSIAYAERRAS